MKYSFFEQLEDSLKGSQDLRVETPKKELGNKYTRTMKGVSFDAYDVLDACGVRCPALQHLAKKVLFTGKRGHKDEEQDLQDIIDSAHRAMELFKNRVLYQQDKT